jgi:hypothetical protein
MSKLPDLSHALDVIHSPTARNSRPLNLAKRSAPMPGDHPDRATYFDLSTQRHTGSGPRVKIHRTAHLNDYRDATGRRINRSMITVPPKVKQEIMEAIGPGQAWTTALIALAEFGAQTLKKQGKVLIVEKAQASKEGR